MAQWYEIPESQRDDEQRKACRTAYYQSLLANPYGRQFLVDMRRRVRELDKVVARNPAFAIVVATMDDFMRETRELCGPVDEMAIIEAEQIVANRAVAATQPRTLEGFREA